MDEKNKGDDERSAKRPRGSRALSGLFAVAVLGVLSSAAIGLDIAAKTLAEAHRHTARTTEIASASSAGIEGANTQADSAPRVLYLSALTLKPPHRPEVTLPSARHRTQDGEPNVAVMQQQPRI